MIPTLLERMGQQNRKFIASIQVDPPTVSDIKTFRETIADLKKEGVRLVDVNSSRRISASSVATSILLAKEGFEVIPHITTRDSSMHNIVNDILAARALANIENFLILTGDPRDEEKSLTPSRGVFEKDAIGATEIIHRTLRKERGLAFSLAAAFNQNAPKNTEAKRRFEKEEAGTDFFMSQPVFSVEDAKLLADGHHFLSRKPLLIGIWPIVSRKTLEGIKNGSIEGVKMPDSVYEVGVDFAKRSSNSNIDEGLLAHWGMAEAKKLIDYIYANLYPNPVAGVYIVAPFRNPLLAVSLVKDYL